MPTLDFYYRNVLGRRLQSAEMDANNQLCAQAYDTIVSISASVAATANFKGNWSALTGPLTVPASVAHSGGYWMLLSNLADVTAATPGVSAAWGALGVGNVQGPVSSVDGDGVVFDGTTGKLTKSLGAAPVKKTGDTMTGALLSVAGTVSAPGLAISGDTNTGIYSPGADQVSLVTGGVQRLSVDASGNVGVGLNNPATFGRVALSGSATGSFVVQYASQGTSGSPATTHVAGAAYSSGTYPAGMYALNSFASNFAHWLAFKTTDVAGTSADRVSIDSAGNLLVVSPALLGYGVGAGGTVTQATSKSTAVALNKPSGRITMNNAALAANTTVAFTLVNSLISAGDTLALEIVSGAAAFTNYRLLAGNAVTAGQRGIAVTNQSGGSLSEAIVIQFNIIKGAAS